MTQKFWENWKKRAGETKAITLINSVYVPGSHTMLYFDNKFYHFENFDFSEDSVTIKYFDTISHNHYKVTLERKNIKSIKF